MHNRPCSLHKSSIKRFCYTIMLRCIGRGETTLRPLFMEESSKFITHELTSSIRAESFHTCIMLCSRPGCKRLVCLECLVFLPKNVELCKASMIMCKCHIILSPSETEIGRRSPYISMDFVAESLSLWCFAFFAYGFPSCLGIFTGVANKRGKVIY